MKMQRRNKVHATGLTSIYKDQNIELFIGKDGHESKVLINGKPPRSTCTGAWITVLPDKPSKLLLEFTKTPDLSPTKLSKSMKKYLLGRNKEVQG